MAVTVTRLLLRVKSLGQNSFGRYFCSSVENKVSKQGLLERLAQGVVVGDGSFVMTLEKRGYVQAGAWTPEAVVQYPDAVRQLHRDYLRAGADVMQTFTFWASDDRLSYTAENDGQQEVINCKTLNREACDLARQVADEGNALVAGSMSNIPGYQEKGKEYVMAEFAKQVEVFKEKGVDFLLGEFFGHAEEAEWAIEAMKKLDVPVGCTMRIGPSGDLSGVTPQECAIRMAKAGADIVGINCNYDPSICLETMKMMKDALDEAGLSCYLMAQPVGWHTQEIRNIEEGYTALPEFPFAMETRLLNRMDVAKFARAAYNLGIRYIGGCCGFEPYHIRAIAEELAPERGRRPPGKDKSGNHETLKKSVSPSQWERVTREYWENLVPSTGRSSHN